MVAFWQLLEKKIRPHFMPTSGHTGHILCQHQVTLATMTVPRNCTSSSSVAERRNPFQRLRRRRRRR